MITMAVDPNVARRVDAAWSARRGWDRREAFDAGRTIYEALPSHERPAWAARLLR
jgi:hypothetical protein